MSAKAKGYSQRGNIKPSTIVQEKETKNEGPVIINDEGANKTSTRHKIRNRVHVQGGVLVDFSFIHFSWKGYHYRDGGGYSNWIIWSV